MKIIFDIADEDAQRAQSFFAAQSANPFVLRRKSRNVDGEREPVDREGFWKAMVNCLLTTQQRSGPDSSVARFIRSEPYPFTLAACRAQRPLAEHVTGGIASFGGIRRSAIIGGELERNLRTLDVEGGWAIIEVAVATLEQKHTPAAERRAAQIVADQLRGLGPKQSRNVLQVLGLTQYEVPIDSRVSKWLHDFGFPLKLSSTALGDDAYYGLVSDGFQALCAAAGVMPCLMDAAIFASFDRAWREEEMIW